MYLIHHERVAVNPVTMEGAKDCTVRWLVGKEHDAPNFAMRQFEVAPGGYTPRHSHPYEHEVFVLEGEGHVCDEQAEHPLRAGDVVYVVAREVHQFRNTGSVPLKFLCLVPNSSYTAAVTVATECAER